LAGPALACLAIWIIGHSSPRIADAQTQPGIGYTVYDNFTNQWNRYNSSPPLPPITPVVASGVTSSINHQWGSGTILSTSLYDDVVVRFTGYLLDPSGGSYVFCGQSDDGFRLFVDSAIAINDWYDRGGGCNQTAVLDFSNGQSKLIDAWWYENGGGAFVRLVYLNGGYWQDVPASWYSLNPATSSTTSTSTTSSTTSTSTSTLPEEATTTTSSEPPAPQTSTSSVPEYSPLPGTTTSTSEATTPPTTAIEQPPTTEPRQEQEPASPEGPLPSPEPMSPETTDALESTESTVESPPANTSNDQDENFPENDSPPARDDEGRSLPESSEPELSGLEPVAEESVQSFDPTITANVDNDNPPFDYVDQFLATDLNSLSDEDKEQIAAAVVLLLDDGLTDEEASGLASNPAVLASINESVASEIFSQLDEASLSPESAALVVEAVQGATDEIRGVFEEVVDLFSGVFDDYTMLGSTINVGQRRTVVAVAALTFAAGMSTPAPAPQPSAKPNDTNTAARKEEEESEASGEIAGDGLQWIRNITIFRHVDGVRFLDWKAFTKKFFYGFMNMGFTLAGSLVVYLTLSGPIQRIAGISTVLAFCAAMWLHMKEPEA
jgi:hypothetical protein